MQSEPSQQEKGWKKLLKGGCDNLFFKKFFMKTYKLKKDLPLAQNGEEVEVSEKWQNLVRIYKKPNNNRSGILICQIKKEDISEWLEEIPQKPKSVWELKDWDLCYSIRSDNDIIEMKWWFGSMPRVCRDIDFLFLTREEAEKELEKRKAIQRVKKYCWENSIELADIDFVNNSDNLKFTINFNTSTKKFIIIHFCISVNTSIFFFKKEEDAQKVLDNCESDLKIIFNI